MHRAVLALPLLAAAFSTMLENLWTRLTAP